MIRTIQNVIIKTLDNVFRFRLQKINTGEYFLNKIPKYINQAYSDLNGYWNSRSCAIVALQMALETMSQKKLDTKNLLNQCLALGGYDIGTDTGWYHTSLVELAREYGIKAEKHKFFGINSQALKLINGNFVLSSLESSNGGHVILLYGVKIDSKHNVVGFWAHDPGVYKHQLKNIFLTSKQFLEKSKFQGITIHE